VKFAKVCSFLISDVTAASIFLEDIERKNSDEDLPVRAHKEQARKPLYIYRYVHSVVTIDL